MYIYEQKDWPNFTWDVSHINNLLGKIKFNQGRLLGKMGEIGFELQKEALLKVFTQDVIKTSEIEGENLDIEEVRSSVANKIGINLKTNIIPSKHVDGIVEIIYDATNNYNTSLSTLRLSNWHKLLFPNGKSGFFDIIVGKFRDDSKGPMQIVSGRIGNERLHFEAPNAKQIDREIKTFLQWFNNNNIDNVIKAAISHLWFITIHPFEDGNGRIARAISDLCLARSEELTQRFYSMSSQISIERKEYYIILEQTQKATVNITSWLDWFLNCLLRAIDGSNSIINVVLQKFYFWKRHAKTVLNERQIKTINKIIDGFEGKITTIKWSKINKCSQDTANRDINDLISKKVLIKNAQGGRSTSYGLLFN